MELRGGGCGNWEVDDSFLLSGLVVPRVDLIKLTHGVEIFLGFDGRYTGFLHANTLIEGL